jgi:hypothetical protein
MLETLSLPRKLGKPGVCGKIRLKIRNVTALVLLFSSTLKWQSKITSQRVFIFLCYLKMQTAEPTALAVVKETRIWNCTKLTILEYTTLIIPKAFS